MKKAIAILVSLFFITSTTSVFANDQVTYGECSMTITSDNVGYGNAVGATNECKGHIVGYYGDGKFLLSGVYTGTVNYSGQVFTISQPFSKNTHERLTVYTVMKEKPKPQPKPEPKPQPTKPEPKPHPKTDSNNNVTTGNSSKPNVQSTTTNSNKTTEQKDTTVAQAKTEDTKEKEIEENKSSDDAENKEEKEIEKAEEEDKKEDDEVKEVASVVNKERDTEKNMVGIISATAAGLVLLGGGAFLFFNPTGRAKLLSIFKK
ncbi:hypothetical protein [Cytobacillus purgationiresistens]|uniref:Uncharacterized protein n=1 Tax=Cytobacillus purgationiresistens TaxID=863449 RepID=A0ABU0AKH2_9BACI|nr:hypothetical protein [Cytobacillus purgationiresistens]MDQ0271221.1 hypothetical protein [Cytobacillus purgationiresistens]